jgi:hypothetical protein
VVAAKTAMLPIGAQSSFIFIDLDKPPIPYFDLRWRRTQSIRSVRIQFPLSSVFNSKHSGEVEVFAYQSPAIRWT